VNGGLALPHLTGHLKGAFQYWLCGRAWEAVSFVVEISIVVQDVNLPPATPNLHVRAQTTEELLVLVRLAGTAPQVSPGKAGM
jgi:hypothetical protein